MSNQWDSAMEAAKLAAEGGHFAQAEKHLQTAVSESKSFDRTDFRVCYAQQKLAEVQQLLGKKDEAIDSLEAALKLRISVLGPHHSTVIASEMELAKLCYETKRYMRAEGFAKDALKLYELTYGTDTEFVGSALLNLATMYHVQKRYDEAEDAYKRTLSVRTYARLMKETHREAEAEHLDSCATGVITGSWKPISFAEGESLYVDERCKFCGAEMKMQEKCQKCGTSQQLSNR
jgi:tetratricopeptide (TPR) repeat protein